MYYGIRPYRNLNDEVARCIFQTTGITEFEHWKNLEQQQKDDVLKRVMTVLHNALQLELNSRTKLPQNDKENDLPGIT